MIPYEYRIESEDNITLNVGSHRLDIEWRWNDVVQEQYDTFTKQINVTRKLDPMISDNGSIIRDYDYLNYYTQTVPQEVTEQEAWLASQTVLPESIRRDGINRLRTNVELANALVIYQEELLERLHYQAIITDETSEKTVADVIIGGWYRNQDQRYAFKFDADINNIRQNQLNLVTMRFEVYDE